MKLRIETAEIETVKGFIYYEVIVFDKNSGEVVERAECSTLEEATEMYHNVNEGINNLVKEIAAEYVIRGVKPNLSSSFVEPVEYIH